jgi:predicted choloylglycine hydrolase
MRYSRNSIFFILIVFSVVPLAISGCGHQKINVQDLLNQPIEEVGHFNFSRKYIKAGITVVYLTGSPYEIGLAHGKLCREEILEINKPIFELYNGMTEESKHWLSKAENLEKQIPAEYIEEMHGIADGSQLEYKKILFLNTVSTMSEGRGCFAFSYRDKDLRIITFRQGDMPTETFLYKKMILYIIKPEKGHGFAAILNPGWVDGESGINEKGVTVTQNNISISQKEWEVMPITLLSRYILQYSKTIEEADQLLNTQKKYPARLLFVSSPKSAAVFEIANNDKARIDMKNGYLATANHARIIPSQPVSGSSHSRLEYANQFLKVNPASMDFDKGLELVRSNKISRRWTQGVQNILSFIYSPSTLDLWIAIAPDSNYIPASYGPFVGFNLMHELYGSGDKPNPDSFPAY